MFDLFFRPSDRNFNPVPWNQYFNASQDIQIETDTFRIYTSGNDGPLLILLHGGGYCGLTWSLFTVIYLILLYFLLNVLFKSIAERNLKSH